MNVDETEKRWAKLLNDSSDDLPSLEAKIKYGSGHYIWSDIWRLLASLANGRRKKWPAEIYAIETKEGKQAILEAFMIGKAKRM